MIIFSSLFGTTGITKNVMNYCKYMDDDIKLEFVMMNDIPENYKKFIKNELNSKYYILPYRNRNPFKYIMKLRDILVSDKVDIVHVHGNSSTLALELLAAKIAGVKVRIAHSRNTTCNHKLSNILLKPIFNMTYTDAFACGNDAGKWMFGKKKFVVIKNGNEINNFKYKIDVRDKVRRDLGLGNDVIALGHVGCFNYQKNQGFLIEIANILKNQNFKFMMFLIGEGDLKKQIENQVNMLSLSSDVVFLGQRDDIQELLQAMDMMLLPSRFEGLPNVLIEWQMAALPSFVSDQITDEAKVTELVKYLPIKDAKVWTDEIIEYNYPDRSLSAIESYEKMKKAGYDIKENCILLKKIYKSLYIESLNNKL